MFGKLTTRQFRLYELLKSNPEKWFTQKEIVESVEGYHYNENPKHTTDHCPTILADKNEINASSEVDKIIVCQKYKFKIATKEEALDEAFYHSRKLIRQAVIIHNIRRKITLDGQGKTVNNADNELTEDNEQFHEVFVNENEKIN